MRNTGWKSRSLTLWVVATLTLTAGPFGCSRPTPPAPTGTPVAASSTAAPQSPTPTPQESASPSADKPQVDTSSWFDFEAPDQSFSVKLPAAPEFTETEKVIAGVELTQYGAVAEAEGNSYSVEWIDYPDPKAAEAAYAEKMKDLQEQSGDKIKAQQTITVDGREGQRFVLADDQGTFVNSLFLVDQRVYDFLILLGSQDPEHDAKANAVSENFKFLK